MVDPRGTAGAIGRVARLEELKLLLAEREYTTTADLAADLGVSLRTLHRDLATLRELGLPIGGLSGRGGGVFLERGGRSAGSTSTSPRRWGCSWPSRSREQVNSPLLLGDIRSIERKVTQAFAPSQAANIRSLRRRVVIGPPASSAVLAGYHPPVAAITRPILEAFTAQRLVEVGYRDQTETRSERAIEIHYLYYSMPVWYALAWDRLRGGVRSFRIDRITTATTAAERFKLEPPDEFLAAVEATTRHL